jgi:hypothetical protein
MLKPQPRQGSPLDVPSIDLDLSAEEIVSAIREGRRPYDPGT